MATGTATYIGGSKSASPWREIRIVVTETGTNVSNNTSTLSYEVWLDNGNTNFSTVKIGCKVVIDSVTVLDRAYSSSSQYSCGRNESVKIASGTTTVTHGSDGKKTIATGTIKATCSSAGIVVSQTATSNSAFVCTDIARASSVSISTNTTVLGQARTITITKSDSTYRHKLYYKFSTQSSYTAITSSYITGTTQSFTPPASLSSLVPSGSASATGTIKCETFTSSGTTAIGESTCSFTGTIPATTPTLSGGTWIGDALTINLSGRASANLTHTLTYKFATQTSATTIVQTTDSQSYSWTPTSAQKTAMVQAVASDNASGSGTITCTTYNGSKSIGSTTKTWTGKIPASTFTRSSASVTMGGSQTFTITRAGSNITHKLTYAFGSLTNQSIGTGIWTSKSWTVPTSLASQLSNASSGTCTVTLTTYNGTVTCGSTSTVTFTAVAPASTFTLSATSVAMGTGTLTITINRATTNMTHTVAYKFNSDSTYTNISTTAGDSASWSPAYTLASKIPSATSGTWNISVTTKIGTATVGSASVKNVTLTVPNNSTTQPTLASISYAPSPNNVAPSGNSNFAGMYIVGMSKVSATFTPTTKYSATIPSTGAVLSVGGATAASGTATSGTQKTLTASKAISSAGSLTAYVKVTDSRGYVKQSANQTITAYAYSEPAVVPRSGTKVICGRSNSSGTLSSSGTYLHIEAGRTITSLNSKNYGSLEYKLYNSSGTLIKSEYILSATTTVTESVSFTSSTALVSDLTSTYRVVLTAYDRFGNETTYTINIPTDSITMDFRLGGLGVGVGMFSQADNELDINPSWHIPRGRIYGLGLLEQIPQNADLNSPAYRIPGRYSVPSNSLAASFSNFPSTSAGTLTVYASSGYLYSDPESQQYAYLIQEYRTYTGNTSYQRHIFSGETAGTWTFGNWMKVCDLNNNPYSVETATLEYESALSTATKEMKIRKCGHIVTVNGYVQAMPSQPASTTNYIGTVPAEFRPPETLRCTCNVGANAYGANTSAYFAISTAGRISVYASVAYTAMYVSASYIRP